jgi:hypothetical protein
MGANYSANYGFLVAEFYANDATWTGGFTLRGRRVSIESFGASPTNANPGQNFTANWTTSYAVPVAQTNTGVLLIRDEGINNDLPNLPPDGSVLNTVQNCCVTYLALWVWGPSNTGIVMTDEYFNVGQGGVPPPPPPPGAPPPGGSTCTGTLCNGTPVTANVGQQVCGGGPQYWLCTAGGFVATGNPCPCGGGTPTVNISCNPASVTYNGSSTVTWSSSNTSNCTVTPTGWTGTSGAQSTGALTATTTYTVNCNP